MTCRLAIFDVTSGETRTVLTTEQLIEAPNWHPDGSRLIVNGDGKLYSVALDDPSLQPIDTGFAKALNNDHGISPDGKHLVISDNGETGSEIYTLPIGGGVPQRITENAPSYWHGWSPDGQTLAYTARRGDDSFEIYSISVNGGPETRLTKGFEHTDGPDFTPDGEWIWFNGQAGGQMDLWRMRPDGSDLQKMTDDAAMNWFPHPSPDGNHILYIAYEPGVQGHPRDHDVELRIMPAQGGETRLLRAIFGGQGSLNVPCWAPDSRAFAYVEVLKDT